MNLYYTIQWHYERLPSSFSDFPARLPVPHLTAMGLGGHESRRVSPVVLGPMGVPARQLGRHHNG